MPTLNRKQIIIESTIELLELPDSAYEKAVNRYGDIGEWFRRKESSCIIYDPNIFPQGSFRLGTAIRPLNGNETYDLDLACELRRDFTKDRYTQENLKRFIGAEIESYRIARGIQAPKEEKHRCWQLDYQDDLSFHMDLLPCIPEDSVGQKRLFESIKKTGIDEALSNSIAQKLIAITDNRHDRYRQICNDWLISNPQGYAQWFEARMRQGLAENRYFAKGQVADVPLFKRKTPLQRTIQLLKRHRNQMFRNSDDTKPISAIITTLAARAYQGEVSIETALTNILAGMGNFVRSTLPRVPNPANPAEDFADRWAMPQYKHLNLKDNFWLWLTQVQADFEAIGSSDDVRFISETINQKFSVNVDSSSLREKLGLHSVTVPAVAAKKTVISPSSANPWKAMS